jgi:hypothetical protein
MSQEHRVALMEQKAVFRSPHWLMIVFLPIIFMASIVMPSAKTATAAYQIPNQEVLSISTLFGTVSNSSWTNSFWDDRRITSFIIQDNFGTTTQAGNYFFSIFFSKKQSNCWQIAAVNQYGQGPFSNQVCYTAPLPKKEVLSITRWSSGPSISKISYSNLEYGDLAITSFLVKDNFGITSKPGSFFSSISAPPNTSNCWQIAAVSAIGQGEWSEPVCYLVPIPSNRPNPGFTTSTCQNTVVSLGWSANYWNQVVDSTIVEDNQGSIYRLEKTAYNATIPNIDCTIARSYKVYYQNTSGNGPSLELGAFVPTPTPGSLVIAPSTATASKSSLLPPSRVGALCNNFEVVASKSNTACAKKGGRLAWIVPNGLGSFTTYTSSNCVGICFGVPSKVNGLPRDTYVSGHYRSNGTYVKPYTRSKP